MNTAQPLRPKHAAVATHHPLATDAARQMLAAGGNATDAAVAAMATLCVVVPGSVGFGGYGGSMIAYDAAHKRTTCLEFNTRCPLEFRENLFAENARCKSEIGYLAVSVPALISGLSAALRDFGTKSWNDVTHHATELAENGFTVDAHHRTVLEKWTTQADALSRRAHFPGGTIPDVGDHWVQKDLAKFLRRLGDEGPDAFYQGDIPEQIVRQLRAHGGILSAEDFTAYHPRQIEPISFNYRGHSVLTPPPTSGGFTALQILQILEQFDLSEFEPWSAAYLNLVAQTCRAVWPDRDKIGDPDFVPIPHDELFSKPLAVSRANCIRKHEIKPVASHSNDPGHTCNVSIIDRFGNFVSLTATQGAQFGSGVVIDGMGLVLGHGMARFTYNQPGHPNSPAPGKRPYHNMCPALILEDDKPTAALGLPGGTRIPTITAQLAISLIDFNATASEAVHAPRVHSEGPGPLIVSKSLSPEAASELEAMGYTLKFGEHALGTPIMLGGPANVVRVNDEGKLDAASTSTPDAALVL